MVDNDDDIDQEAPHRTPTLHSHFGREVPTSLVQESFNHLATLVLRARSVCMHAPAFTRSSCPRCLESLSRLLPMKIPYQCFVSAAAIGVVCRPRCCRLLRFLFGYYSEKEATRFSGPKRIHHSLHKV
jgi:hypothetical protein